MSNYGPWKSNFINEGSSVSGSVDAMVKFLNSNKITDFQFTVVGEQKEYGNPDIILIYREKIKTK
jgi:hypothetical protein